MINRYVVSYDQLKIIRNHLNQFKTFLNGVDDSLLNDAIRMVERIFNEQELGHSRNAFFDDIRDLRNLFASWCGTAKDDK